MGVTALVMAGGKGSRMQHFDEKPLICVEGKPIVERVIEALQQAKGIESIAVAVSHHTPKTAAFVTRFSVMIVPTSGKGYIQDTQYVVKHLKLRRIMTVSADLPLVTGEVFDEIVGRYKSCGKPALTLVVSDDLKERLGLSLDHSFQLDDRTVVPVGINLIDGRRIDEDELEQEVFLLDRLEVAVNVNTIEELALTAKLVRQR